MKPNIFRSLWIYTKVIIPIPFYSAWKKNAYWKKWERIFIAISCLLFWWLLIPLYAIKDYKQDKAIYEATK